MRPTHVVWNVSNCPWAFVDKTQLSNPSYQHKTKNCVEKLDLPSQWVRSLCELVVIRGQPFLRFLEAGCDRGASIAVRGDQTSEGKHVVYSKDGWLGSCRLLAYGNAHQEINQRRSAAKSRQTQTRLSPH